MIAITNTTHNLVYIYNILPYIAVQDEDGEDKNDYEDDANAIRSQLRKNSCWQRVRVDCSTYCCEMVFAIIMGYNSHGMIMCSFVHCNAPALRTVILFEDETRLTASLTRFPLYFFPCIFHLYYTLAPPSVFRLCKLPRPIDSNINTVRPTSSSTSSVSSHVVEPKIRLLKLILKMSSLLSLSTI